MKTLEIEQATLGACVREAQEDRVLVTRGGQPVALFVGLEGLDEEQVQLGRSAEFWELIVEWREVPEDRTQRRLLALATVTSNRPV